MHAKLLETLTGTRKFYAKLQQTLSETAFNAGRCAKKEFSIFHRKFEVTGFLLRNFSMRFLPVREMKTGNFFLFILLFIVPHFSLQLNSTQK